MKARKKNPMRAAKAPAFTQAMDVRKQGNTPSFRRPPLDEVVCGIRFEPLGQFKLPFVGFLWQRLSAQYPRIEHTLPLPAGNTLAVDTATGTPLPRVWFINEPDDELIQFQVDLLYYNWRRREHEYPRFKAIFPKFEAAKSSLEALLIELKQDPLVIVEHELTYINHIPQGDGWETLADLPKVLPIFCATSEKFRFLPPPRNMAWSMRFELPETMGHLNIRLSEATRRTDKRPVLVLQLSARGTAASASWESSRVWFETAHEWIVRGFADLTAPEMQEQYWEREQ